MAELLLEPGGEAFLVVYVDDFKLAALKASCQRVWAKIRKGIKVEDPQPAGLYLGCRHIVTSGINKKTGKKENRMGYDMSEFLASCVARYCELSGARHLKRVATPFLAESGEGDEIGRPAPSCPTCGGSVGATACWAC